MLRRFEKVLAVRGLCLAISVSVGCQMTNPEFEEVAAHGDTNDSQALDLESSSAQDSGGTSAELSDSTADESGSSDIAATTSSETTATTTTFSIFEDSTTSDETTTETLTTTATTTLTDESTTLANDFETVEPEVGVLLPLPVPFCPQDADLLSCLQFDQASLTEATDGSMYQHDAVGTSVVRRWIHSDAGFEFVGAGWETAGPSRVVVAPNSDLRFDTQVRLEAWWHPTSESGFNYDPIVSLKGMIAIYAEDFGYACAVSTPSGTTTVKYLSMNFNYGVEYVSCSLKNTTLVIEAANDIGTAIDFNVGIGDLSFYRPALEVMQATDVTGTLKAQTGVIYGVRAWRREQP